MKSFAVIGFAAAAAALPQGSSGDCPSSASGSFQISTVNVTNSKRDLERRQLSGTLTLSLQDGILKDQAGRQGYIAANDQFQFDSPIQEGAKETEGFGLCSNSSLSLQGSTIFYQCLSGEFYNLYSASTGAQCIPIHIQAVMGGGASQIPDGQPQATSAGGAVTQISDGQPQATSAGQVVSQIPDGQPQATTPAGPAVTQISDGQPQASAPGPKVTQISDGQPQASAPAPKVTQISDGQPQASAPAPAGNVTASLSQPPIPEFTGAAATSAASIGALAAGLLGLFALL